MGPAAIIHLDANTGHRTGPFVQTFPLIPSQYRCHQSGSSAHQRCHHHQRFDLHLREVAGKPKQQQEDVFPVPQIEQHRLDHGNARRPILVGRKTMETSVGHTSPHTASFPTAISTPFRSFPKNGHHLCYRLGDGKFSGVSI